MKPKLPMSLGRKPKVNKLYSESSVHANPALLETVLNFASAKITMPLVSTAVQLGMFKSLCKIGIYFWSHVHMVFIKRPPYVVCKRSFLFLTQDARQEARNVVVYVVFYLFFNVQRMSTILFLIVQKSQSLGRCINNSEYGLKFDLFPPAFTYAHMEFSGSATHKTVMTFLLL